jgi:hypothetical protein
MTRVEVESLTDQQLYDRFVELSTEMGEIYNRSTRRYNRLFDVRHELVTEIRARRGDVFSLLLPALRHENPWVRYAAVAPCFEGAPDEALTVLRDLSGLRFHTLAPIAAMGLAGYEGRLPSPEAAEFYDRMQTRREHSE